MTPTDKPEKPKSPAQDSATPASARSSATRARKASILKAALECFAEHGVEHTTIHQIQARADCSIGSIYHHFGSKEGIAEELFLEGVQRLNRSMLRKIRSCANAQQGVHAVVGAYCDWSARHPQLARYLHSRDIDFSPEARKRLHDIHRDYITAVFTWFAPYVTRGEMRILPIEAYVPLISGPIQEYVRRWLSGHHSNGPLKVKALFAEAAWNAVKG